MTAVSVGAGIAQKAGGDGGQTARGETRAANMGTGDIDVFTISANQGGALLATIGETTLNSPLTSQIVLYGPTGNLVTFAQSATGTTITANNLAASGLYTIVVRDFNGNAVGGYAMT